MNTKAILNLLSMETEFPLTELQTIFYSVKVNHELFTPLNSMVELDEFGYQGTITIELQYHPLYFNKVTKLKEQLDQKLHDHSFRFKEILESQSEPDCLLNGITHSWNEKLVLIFDIKD